MKKLDRSLRATLKLARRLGCAITKPRGTGEVLVVHPCGTPRVRVNSRRSSAPRELTLLVKRLCVELAR